MEIFENQPDLKRLSNVGILSDLSEPEMSAIEKQCEWLQCKQGDIILEASDPEEKLTSHDVYFLTAGSVSIITKDDDDNELILAQ